MHLSSLEKMARFGKTLDSNQSLKILDFGSRDINGSYKSIFEKERWQYTGVDLSPGKNVDIVLSDPYRWPIKDCSYDVVISGQKLENVEWFWEVMREVSRVLKPGGIVCIIVPSSGFEHRSPVDTYRFYPDGLRAMSKWAGLEVIEANTDWGSSNYKDSSNLWRDSLLIAKKPNAVDSRQISIIPLVSRDLARSIRIVSSAFQQQPTSEYKFVVHPVINSKDDEFINDFSSWCRDNNVTHTITESNGTPSKGKNEAIKSFKKSNSSGMVLIDGDDILYPTATRQLEFHLKQFPSIDFLVARGVDKIHSGQEGVKITDNINGNFWSYTNFNPKLGDGPGKHGILTDGRRASSNMGSHIFYSRKLTDLVSYDEDQLLGEDLLFEINALREYVRGNIFFMSTTASDFYILDRTSSNDNIQKKHNDSQGERFFERILEVVRSGGEDRTSFNEVPVRYPDLMLNYSEKIEFAKYILSKSYDLSYKI